ncbi:MAG: hypothetical protein II610_06825 [Treponema sp.]|nr:hypothetical protein [Treponema sp.]MBR3544059.1 hypothetical protein [Treponema sp.]
MNIKKMIVAATLSALVLAGTFAETNAGGHKKSEISYYSAPVYKVMDSAKAYTVIYGKAGHKMGTVTIPKDWAKNKPDTVKKLLVRNCPTKITPYVTIVKKSGEFLKVMLTVPTNHNDRIWGIANENKVESTDGVESVDLEL